MMLLKLTPCMRFCGVARAAMLAVAVACGGGAARCVGASLIQNFAAASNDRFANDAAFIGSGLDWSGVGRSSDGHWGTMLTPTVFLSASHYHPGVGSVMSFFPGNDPGATAVARSVASGQRIGTSDLWVGFLSTAVPASITSYEFAQVTLTEATFAASGLSDLLVFMGGLTPTATGYGAATTTVQTVGSNRLEGFFEDATDDGHVAIGDILATVQNLAGDGSFGFTHSGFEAQLQGGDSGSPLMMLADGRLVLAGIAWAIGTTDIDPDPTGVAARPITAFTYTGSYAGELLSIIPEPGVGVLALLAGAVLALRRGRGR